MKYLPRKYQESQSDWYGKRGNPWHITVATRKSAVKYEMLTFVHIFPSCSQDSCAVIAVCETTQGSHANSYKCLLSTR